MGRQWLLAKREVNALKKSKSTGKFVREITIAARQGGADPENNARLFAALEKARDESVSKEVIERAINKGIGIGGEKEVIHCIFFEGYAPHKVPVIVEVFTDNTKRTTPEIRVLFRDGVLGAPGSNKFLFEHVGIVEAYTDYELNDLVDVAIEAGSNDVDLLTHNENDAIPEQKIGARFITKTISTTVVASWLKSHGWNVVTSEIGYIAKHFVTLTHEQRLEVGEFLQKLQDHEDVHRVWAAIK